VGRVGSNLVSALSMFKLAQLFFQGTNHVCFRLHGTMWLTIQIIRISTVKAVQKLAKCDLFPRGWGCNKRIPSCNSHAAPRGKGHGKTLPVSALLSE